MTAEAQVRLVGKVAVALPAKEAFHLFTPLGERDWVPGWEPRFPAAAADDSMPGTVFETGAHGRTATWLVLERIWGKHIRYARVIPQATAGTVTVTLDEDGIGSSTATVTYELTALTEAAGEELKSFADNYPVFLRSWEDAISAYSKRAMA